MAVLQRKELEASPLADLHAIASELGLEGFRSMRRPELIAAILEAQGGEDAAAVVEEDREPDEVPSKEALEGPAEEEREEEEEEEEEEESSEDTSEETSEDTSEEALEADEDEQSGDHFEQPRREDVYVSPAQIRRCELRSGDEVSGPVRPPRRNERHPSLVRVETVNGAEAEPPEQRPWFAELIPVLPSERIGDPGALESVPFGKGSRVAVSGPPGAGASTLLRDVAKALSEQYPDLAVSVVLAGVRPEEVAEWRELGLEVVGGSFERPPEAQAQAAELAVERAKRVVERGGDAAVIIDALDALPPGVRRRLFGAARATEEGGTLTIVAATGDEREVLRCASTRIVLEGAGRVASDASGALRADRLT